MANQWLQSSLYAPLPTNAIVGGYDTDGSPIYVGRCFHEGDLLPVKVIPSQRKAFVAWQGAGLAKEHYELLVGENYSWQPCSAANIPPNALSTGKTANGEPLYVGRGHHANSLVVGKIQPSHGCLYIPFNGEEIKLEKYEILVYGGAGVDHSSTQLVDVSQGHKWLPFSAYSAMPPNAVEGGQDCEGNKIYVGRSFHNGDMLVAQIIPAKQMAFASWRGSELPKDHFELLCGDNLIWRHCYNHIIPENAVVCGTTSLDQPVYIGRGHYEGNLSVGRISKVHHALFVPFKGVERRLDTYEILVEENQATVGWKVEPLTDPMPMAPPLAPEVVCPYPVEKSCPYPSDIKPAIGLPEIKPAISMQMPMVVPAPIDPPPPYTAVMSSTTCSQKPMPMPTPMPTSMPTSYAIPAETYQPPARYTPPPAPAQTYNHYETPCTYDKWVSVTPSYTPPNAVHAGHDSDMSPIYVCRAYHNGDFIPGKAVPCRSSAYVSFQGQEIYKAQYEMLVGSNYMWVYAHDGYALGAVEAGRTENGETLYIGRANYCGSLTCGKIQRSHGCLYIPYGGREVRIHGDYEILVRRNEFYHRGMAKWQ